MKIRLRYISLSALLIFIIFIAGKFLVSGIEPKAVSTSAKAVSTNYDLKVIKAVNVLKHGETGAITIQGRPGIKYTIISYYSVGKEFLETKQQRTTDEFGQVTFLWTVSNKTVPGTYLVTITGDGQKINLDHTVIE